MVTFFIGKFIYFNIYFVGIDRKTNIKMSLSEMWQVHVFDQVLFVICMSKMLHLRSIDGVAFVYWKRNLTISLSNENESLEKTFKNKLIQKNKLFEKNGIYFIESSEIIKKKIITLRFHHFHKLDYLEMFQRANLDWL